MCVTLEDDAKLHSNTVIWRYLSFNRFKQLIQTQKLYFSRIDQFSDFNEGLMTEKEVDDCTKELSEQGAHPEVAQALISFNRLMQHKYYYASCWSKCNYEQNLLWRSYGTPDASDNDKEKFKVAIKTTVGKLSEALSMPNNISLVVKLVKYIDDKTEKTTNDFDNKVFYKRKEYESEKEVRFSFRHNSFDQQVQESLDSGEQLLINGKQIILGSMKSLDEYPDTPKGLLLDLDPSVLIDKVYIEAIPIEWQKLLEDAEYKKQLEDDNEDRFFKVKSLLTKSGSECHRRILPSNIL